MPAAGTQKLSLQEFHARYDGENPYYEYWDGEAVQKSMPTVLHGLIEKLSARLLDGIGYAAVAEVTIKLDPAYELIPDVIALDGPIGDPYPTSPFEVAIEVLSPDDSISRVLRRCGLYGKWGIRQIVVLDPKERIVWRFEKDGVQEADILARRGDAAISAQTLWDEVDREISRWSVKP